MSEDFAQSRLDLPPIPHPQHTGCTSYVAGHNVHFIQALHSANRLEVARLTWPGTIVGIDGEVLSVRDERGHVVGYCHHDPARLDLIVQHVGASVRVNARYSILRIGSHCFSVQSDDGQPLGPCPTDELGDDATLQQAAVRIGTHGGISLRPTS